jgi:hypothetical protein
MNRLFRLLGALAIAAASIGFSVAGVRVVLNRPGCTTPDASVEVINTMGDLWWKVKIEGNIGNASPGPSDCSDSTACTSSFPSPDTYLILGPCPSGPHGISRCGARHANLPTCWSCLDGCSLRSCDNRTQSNSNPECGANCQATCGNPNTEWCSAIGDLQVTRVATSTDGTTWTNDGTVLCRHGSYGSSPACTIDSYCTNHSSVTPACSNLDPDPACDYQ